MINFQAMIFVLSNRIICFLYVYQLPYEERYGQGKLTVKVGSLVV